MNFYFTFLYFTFYGIRSLQIGIRRLRIGICSLRIRVRGKQTQTSAFLRIQQPKISVDGSGTSGPNNGIVSSLDSLTCQNAMLFE